MNTDDLYRLYDLLWARCRRFNAVAFVRGDDWRWPVYARLQRQRREVQAQIDRKYFSPSSHF